jgi:hypothetical protein
VTQWKRKVVGPDGLHWTVKRLMVPVGMRVAMSEVLDDAAPRRYAPTPLGFVLMLPLLPFLPLIVLLRTRGRIPWLLEARTYPWGRRYPPVVLRYEVRQHDYADWALDQLVDGLERGDGAPVLLGAERI